jgi:hypothetical protein
MSVKCKLDWLEASLYSRSVGHYLLKSLVTVGDYFWYLVGLISRAKVIHINFIYTSVDIN